MKSVRSALVASVVAINCFVFLLLGYELHGARLQKEREVATSMENVTLLLDQTITASVQKIDLALREITEELTSSLQHRGQLDAREVNDVLSSWRRRLSPVIGIRVTDVAGIIRYGADAPPGTAPSYADRDFFIAQRASNDGRLVISDPVLGRISQTRVIAFTRRYEYPDGRFAGVVAAAVPVDYFAGLLSGLDLGPHGGALLRDSTAALIVRHPPNPATAEQPGARTFSKELGDIIASGVPFKTYHSLQTADGRERVNTYRRLSAVPFHLVAGEAAEDYLADWRRMVERDAAIGLIFLSVTSTLAWSLWRSLLASERADEERRIAAVAFESRQGMVVTDAHSNIIRVNRTFTELTGYEAAEVVGGKPSMLKSGRHDDEFYAGMWRAIQEEGFWQGEIWNRRKNGEVYPEWLTITAVRDPRGVITHYVASFWDITRRIEDETEIRNLAFFDPLTGLANRRLLTDRLHHAFAKSSRSARYGALLYVDLDRFKELNDSLGHAQGDRLLELVADRLRVNVREGDTVARFGGDEFVVLLEDLDLDRERAADSARAIGEKLCTALGVPYRLQATHADDWHCTASIGASLFRGHDDDLDAVLARADAALYAAKGAGRNTVRFS
ncbi:MAG TPA: diguanylate cyclase [Rhodocyclaceae bacterium]